MVAVGIAIGLGAFLMGMLAIASKWDGLAQEISFLTAFAAIPLTLVGAFPGTIHHIKVALRIASLGLVLVGMLFAARYIWFAREQPVMKIAVSLPFGNDPYNASPLYDAIKRAFESEPGKKVQKINDYTFKIDNRMVQLVPFDDSEIGDNDCLTDSCPITMEDGANPTDTKKHGVKAQFRDITGDPEVVGIIGPFNSGVAVREFAAAAKAHVPLVSPWNTADCLSNPVFANGDCDVSKLGKGSYFRLASPDSVRQKALADYLWDNWQKSHPSTVPKIVIYEESGPRANTFSKGSGDRFQEAWKQHISVGPSVYPLSDASSEADLKDSLRKLTFTPDIILYAGTGRVGAQLYQAAAELGLSDAIFAGPGSIENDEYAQYIINSKGGPLYAVDFAAASKNASDAPDVDTFHPPKFYGATAYDATKILLRSATAVFEDNKALLKSFAFRTRLERAAAPVRLGVETSLRKQTVTKISWLNTKSNDPKTLEYHGATGTYSFNNNDADGAAGVTILTFDPVLHTWESPSYKDSQAILFDFHTFQFQ